MQAKLREDMGEEAFERLQNMTPEQGQASLAFQKAFSSWPSVAYDGPIIVQAAWKFCRKQMQEGRREGLRAIKHEERELAALIEEANADLRRELDAASEDRGLFEHVLEARRTYDVNLFTIRRFMRQYLATFSIPPPLSEEDAQAITDSRPGYYAAEYAEEARKVLAEHRSISTFTKLATHMGGNGTSKVDTIKRGIGYDGLPTEEKGFSRFKAMLSEE